MADLKPCPFCGSAPELRTSHGWHAVGCSTFMKCPASIHALTHRSEADAVRAWNTRTPGVLEPRKPDGYAYAYDSPFGGIRFNNGEPVNGSKPTRAIPYWLGAPPNGVKTGGGTDGR